MEMSTQIADFAVAMAKVQSGIGSAIKDKVNPAFKSKYADLSAVWDAFQSVGPANGFSVMQLPGEYSADSKTMSMTQVVLHSSGQWIRSTLSIPLTKVDAQGYGSAVTYLRRYSLAAAFGICPDDDDGNAASVRGRGANDSNGDVVNADQLQKLQDEADAVQADLLKFCKFMGVASLRQIPASEYARALSSLQAKRKAA